MMGQPTLEDINRAQALADFLRVHRPQLSESMTQWEARFWRDFSAAGYSAAAEQAAYERAARLADGFATNQGDLIAAGIRALKPQPPDPV